MFETLDNLIFELRSALKGRSNLIDKDEIREILDKYEKKGFNIFDKKENEKGIITKLVDDFKFKNSFTDEEKKQIEKIRKHSYLKTMKELAEEDGKDRAKRKFPNRKL